MSPEYYSALYTRSCFMFSELYTESFKAAVSCQPCLSSRALWTTIPSSLGGLQTLLPRTAVPSTTLHIPDLSLAPFQLSPVFCLSWSICSCFFLCSLFLFVLLSLPSLYSCLCSCAHVFGLLSWFTLGIPVCRLPDPCLPVSVSGLFFWISLPVNSTCVHIPLCVYKREMQHISNLKQNSILFLRGTRCRCIRSWRTDII